MRNARWPIWCLMLLAIAAELLPLPAFAQAFRPALTTMTLIYWTLMWPGRFGIFTAFVFGLLIDIAHGSLLGEHALILSVVSYVVLRLHLQLRVFPVWQLTLAVFALLFLEAFLLLWIDGATGHATLGPQRWGPVFAGAVFWPILMAMMDRVRERLERRKSSFS